MNIIGRVMSNEAIFSIRKQWVIRFLAFNAIIGFEAFSVSPPKQVDHPLYKYFGVSTNDGISTLPQAEKINSLGFEHTPYYKHIRTLKRVNGITEDGIITRNLHNNSNGASSEDHGVRIAFSLHDPITLPLTQAYNSQFQCRSGKVAKTGEFRTDELPPSLFRVQDEHMMQQFSDIEFNVREVIRSGRVLDFTATISTNLKLLFIGDSVMCQLAQAFDEMVDPDHGKGGRKKSLYRKIIWDSWPGHDGGTILAPARGGGASAMWRMTALLSKSRKGKPPANRAGGGWDDKEINKLLGHSYNPNLQHQQQQPHHNATIGNFDAVIYRVMHGWMKSQDITNERIVEAVELCHELLGATTVVLMTIPFTNNVVTSKDWLAVQEINDFIREMARDWYKRENTGVQHVLVMEYGTYYNHLTWSNARHLGLYSNVSHPLKATHQRFILEGPSFLMDRLDIPIEWKPSISMVCSETTLLKTTNIQKCNRNYLFYDGMHVCPETLSSRYAASVACLLGCVYNQHVGKLVEGKIMICERECNDQFMSVVPVEESWVDTNTTLASFPG